MFSLYTARKKDEESLRSKNATQIERYIRSTAHKNLTQHFAHSHRNRVDEWMHRTLQADVPELPEKPLAIADLQTQPYKFYRTRSPTRGNGSSTARTRTDNALPIVHSGSATARSHHSQYNQDIPDHVQMSPRRYVTEAERIKAYEKSEQRAMLVGKEPYLDPLTYSFRTRDRSHEVGGEFRFKPVNERQRIQEAITARDIGGRAFPWEEQRLYPSFRDEHKDKWRAGPFHARLPALPLFNHISPTCTEEPYQDSVRAHDGLFRAASPLGGKGNGHPERFTSCVPSDRFISLLATNKRAPHPPVDPWIGTNTLSQGLGSSGIYDLNQPSAEELANGWGTGTDGTGQGQGHVASKSFWKSAITLAHQPPSNQPRGDTETAQQLFRTYRRHLAY